MAAKRKHRVRWQFPDFDDERPPAEPWPFAPDPREEFEACDPIYYARNIDDGEEDSDHAEATDYPAAGAGGKAPVLTPATPWPAWL